MGKALRFRKSKIHLFKKRPGARAQKVYVGDILSSVGTFHPSRDQDEPPEIAESSNLCSETAYTKAKRREISAWDLVKDDILKVSFACSAPITGLCIVCQDHGDYRCLDCGPTTVFCEACLKKSHRNLLHLPDKWNKAYYEPLSSGLQLILPEGHENHNVYKREMRVVVNSGRLCNICVNLCNCEPEVCTLVRYGLWPASAEKPQTAFSISLLELFIFLSLECQVSVDGFCNTLRWKNSLTLAEQDGNMIVTLDGNFGLVRKQSSGASIDKPFHGNRMFIGDGRIEEYLSSHPENSKPNEDCSNFKAGNLLRSGKQTKKLDVTGVFGASCRHEIPLMFVNMSQGERLAYPLYIIEELLQKCNTKNIHLRVVYDIACVLASHMQKSNQGIPHNLSLAVPAFHVYGHKLQCQIMYSTRRLDGFGLTDGEGMERLWSFLRRFARITKEMTPSHRMDLLTDALLHYGWRKATDLDMQLLLRVEKAEKMTVVAKDEISMIIREAPVPVSEQDMERWKKTEAELVRQKPKPKNTVPRWRKEYVIKLIQYNMLNRSEAEESFADIAEFEKTLLNWEEKYCIGKRWHERDVIFQSTLKDVDCDIRRQLLFKARTEARERAVLLQLKRKYPDGQGIAIRLSKQVANTNKRLKQTLSQYNNILWPPKTDVFPATMSFQDICDPSWPVYSLLDETIGDGDDSVPRCLKRRGIDAVYMKARAAEEKVLVHQEMKCVIDHLHQQHAFLHSAIISTNEPGAKAALIQRIIQLERRLHCATHAFHHHVPHIPSAPCNYITPGGLHHTVPLHEIETLDGDEDEEEDEDDD
ncbi:uncharacterized protein LOC111195712 isoform X3 [Astyanax mexicanus]|uniref:uncharacterized protein LOC111195712 isoform X3 n=1 Tax=Astyanax mexicanus TaxID=7994 RepID=UPI0020CAD221|nr:uncharacterized protein LOC111195712 isoform X3 [Astyanax mexicanus]